MLGSNGCLSGIRLGSMAAMVLDIWELLDPFLGEFWFRTGRTSLTCRHTVEDTHKHL